MVFSFDATGFGNSQLTTVALRNPYKRASAAQLRLLGVGFLSDSREGALKVISETNLEQIRAAIRHDQARTTMPVKLQVMVGLGSWLHGPAVLLLIKYSPTIIKYKCTPFCVFCGSLTRNPTSSLF